MCWVSCCTFPAVSVTITWWCHNATLYIIAWLANYLLSLSFSASLCCSFFRLISSSYFFSSSFILSSSLHHSLFSAFPHFLLTVTHGLNSISFCRPHWCSQSRCSRTSSWCSSSHPTRPSPMWLPIHNQASPTQPSSQSPPTASSLSTSGTASLVRKMSNNEQLRWCTVHGVCGFHCWISNQFDESCCLILVKQLLHRLVVMFSLI